MDRPEATSPIYPYLSLNSASVLSLESAPLQSFGAKIEGASSNMIIYKFYKDVRRRKVFMLNLSFALFV